MNKMQRRATGRPRCAHQAACCGFPAAAPVGQEQRTGPPPLIRTKKAAPRPGKKWQREECDRIPGGKRTSGAWGTGPTVLPSLSLCGQRVAATQRSPGHEALTGHKATATAGVGSGLRPGHGWPTHPRCQGSSHAPGMERGDGAPRLPADGQAVGPGSHGGSSRWPAGLQAQRAERGGSHLERTRGTLGNSPSPSPTAPWTPGLAGAAGRPQAPGGHSSLRVGPREPAGQWAGTGRDQARETDGHTATPGRVSLATGSSAWAPLSPVPGTTLPATDMSRVMHTAGRGDWLSFLRSVNHLLGLNVSRVARFEQTCQLARPCTRRALAYLFRT